MSKDNLKNKIVTVVLGIRFSKSFAVMDVVGGLIDDVLRNPKSPFSEKMFPNIQEHTNRERILYHRQTLEYLRINTDDLILQIKVGENEFDKKFKWLQDTVVPYLEYFFKLHEIKNIRRIGVVLSHKIVKNEKFNSAIKSITNEAVSNPDNINISFSQKSSVTDSLLKKNTNDHKKQIYSLRDCEDSNEIYADLDYQHYYEPILEDMRDCHTKKVLEEAANFLEKNFHIWLNKN